MSILSPQSRVLPNIAGILGAIPILIGIKGLLQPAEVLQSVGFPASATPEAQELADALTRLLSARNVTVGLIGTAVWYRGDRKMHGWTMIVLSFYPLVDGLVTRTFLGEGLARHLPVAVTAFGLGAAMAGWLG